MLLRRVIEHVKTQNWFAVGIDFLIVVVGVYTAVWVEGVQGRIEQDRKTAQIIETLRSDLRGSEDFEDSFTSVVQASLMKWEKDVADGKMPPPVFFRVPGSDTPPANTWDALLNMNLGDLLPPDLVFELAFYYSEREGVGRKYIRYIEFVESEILPFLGGDPGYFYQADGRTLKPRFAASMDRMRDWQLDARQNVVWAQCLDRRLEDPDDSSVECHPDFSYDYAAASTAPRDDSPGSR